MLKQRHYHLYVVMQSALLCAAGGLLATTIYYELGWATIAIAAGACAYMMKKIWDTATYIPNQVEYFLGCLLSKDATSIFPETKDSSLALMYSNMNRIMKSYGQARMEIETKRMYYDRILRIMTHELRNSITPMITLSEDMLTSEYSQEDSKEAIEVINEQCVSIKKFLDSYYELTHLPKPDKKPLDVKQLFVKLERLYSANNNDQLKLNFKCAQGMTIDCDESQINQVLNNLIKNAIEELRNTTDKRMKKNGGEEAGEITVTASEPNGKARITVVDNGPGVPQNKTEEIFLPFYTSKSGGSGIGLAISRQIMQLHGGTLTCDSNDGEGATFAMEF